MFTQCCHTHWLNALLLPLLNAARPPCRGPLASASHCTAEESFEGRSMRYNKTNSWYRGRSDCTDAINTRRKRTLVNSFMRWTTSRLCSAMNSLSVNETMFPRGKSSAQRSTGNRVDIPGLDRENLDPRPDPTKIVNPLTRDPVPALSRSTNGMLKN